MRPEVTAPRRPLLKWILLALALAAAVAAGRLLPVASWTKQLEGWISGLGALGYADF